MPIIVPPPATKVLVVGDGYDTKLFSFSAKVDPTDTYFTLTQFVSTMRGFGWGSHRVLSRPIFELTLAHRDVDQGLDPSSPDLLADTVVNAWFTWHGEQPPPAPAAGEPAKNVVELSDFDVIFMFGFDVDQSSGADPRSNLCWDGGGAEDQVWAFVQFMQDGRGIFATGDHEDRGSALCGSIPRVRAMRRWWWDYALPANRYNKGEGPYGSDNYGFSFVFSVTIEHPFNRAPYTELGDMCAPPAVGPYRLDTTQPGPKGVETVYDVWVDKDVTGVPFDRQSDDIPQPLRVTVNHPILALSTGRTLSQLPDHMHEGLVIGTGDADKWGFASNEGGMMNAGQTFSYWRGGHPVAEFPTVGGNQPLPQVIAQISNETYPTPSTEKAHGGALDAPFSGVWHGAISVYDGTAVNVGRLVAQTTFHHFIDLNLTGDPLNPARTGFTPKPGILEDFASYWFNLAVWLAPTHTRRAMFFRALDLARREPTIRMAARPAMALSGNAVHDIGQMVAQRLDDQFPALLVEDMMHAALAPEHSAKVKAVITHRARAVPRAALQIRRSLLHGFLGGAVLHVLDPSSPSDEEGRAQRTVSAGLHGAGRSLTVSPHALIIDDLINALHDFGG